MLVDGRSGSGDQITAAIRSASRTTGATFDYLLNTAIRESSLDPTARARTSSARGLYQFIESTWLTMVKEEGEKFGLDRYADSIQRGPDGQYTVNDPAVRAKILKLREDPRSWRERWRDATPRNCRTHSAVSRHRANSI
jgi:hypothetical protein